MFKNLGVEKAEKMYKEYRENGLSENDAWLEVYSTECVLDIFNRTRS